VTLSRRLVPALFIAVLAAASAPADEGMWMPQQIPALAPKLVTMGFTGDPKAFADLTGQPMGAIVSLGGCSASFVSSDGLIATNHHCVQGGLQYNSTPQRSLLEDGFLARTKSEELWNGPGSRVTVTVSVKEVTDEIAGKVDPRALDGKRHEIIERRIKEHVAACEKSGLRCRVAPFFDGLKYFELAQMEIQDVRLVWAPAAGIGNYGGETDNWQWPRHTGDFSMLRAYVSPSGKSAPFAKENVPYKPSHWLKVSPEGANPGDLVFVAGYPGRTQRLETFAQVKETAEWTFPRVVRRYTDQIAILESLSRASKETAIRVTTKKRGLNNTLTNRKGMLNGFYKGGLLKNKEAQEKDLAAWIAADPARQKDYGDVLPALNALQAAKEKTRERDAVLNDLLGVPAFAAPVLNISSLANATHVLYRLSLERPKKDADRTSEFQERNWGRLREAQERFQRNYDPKADRALARYVFVEAAKLPAGQRIEAMDKAVGLSTGMPEAAAPKAIDSYLDRLYEKTKLGDQATRLALFEKTTAEIVATKDPMVEFVTTLRPLWDAVSAERLERSGAMERIGPRYTTALLAKSGGLVAPDANSTLRVTFGKVMGVSAKDGLIYTPQTTLSGVIDKHTGEGDFNVPKKERDAAAALKAGKKTPYLDAKLMDVPVNFLSTVDTTGGNSGSATLNSRGELCGLLFDGTFDTIASDYLYDPVKTRSIHVDSRYMLWTLSEVDGATNLLEELGETKSLDVQVPTH
jgi:hypothetical protein